ncbi:MAG: PspC domain-containing protein [Phocaeicola plebeius]|nr:PspC domain-containing protein [Phocaeicola plebeius]
MKKTLTVNLGGTVYHIDEDAYVLLDNYLKNLHYHFRQREGAEEIVRDMEARIAELFDEYLRQGLKVITIHEAETVIARMGKPEELGDEEAATTESTYAAAAQGEGPRRRLFRNEDDRVLGGVASGIAAYMGWEVVYVRLALLLLGFFVQGLIVAYLVCWMVIPAAKTATEKLQMQGKPVNMENIGKTVTDGFERVNEYVHSGETRSFLARVGNVIVQMAGFIIKLALVLIAICCTPVLVAVLFVFFALLLMGVGLTASLPVVFYHAFPFIDWNSIGTQPLLAIILALCGLLAVGLPIVGLLQLVFQSLKMWRPMSTGVKVGLILLWMVAIAIGLVLLLQVPFVGESYFPNDSRFYGNF